MSPDRHLRCTSRSVPAPRSPSSGSARRIHKPERHAVGKHGGSVVEALPEVEHELPRLRVSRAPVASSRQVRVRVRVHRRADIVELRAGQRGEFSGCVRAGHRAGRAVKPGKVIRQAGGLNQLLEGIYLNVWGISSF